MSRAYGATNPNLFHYSKTAPKTQCSRPGHSGRLRSVHSINACQSSAASTPTTPLSSLRSAPSASPHIPRAYAHTHSARAFCRRSMSGSNLHAGHDDALAPDPHVVSDDRVALARKLRHVRRRILRPGAAENVEWIRRGAADAVVRRTHDKLRAGRDLTELADHKMIAELRVVEQHIVPLKPVGSTASS